jgi:hypothetical protein
MAGRRRRCTAWGRTDAGQNGGALWTPTIDSYRVVGIRYSWVVTVFIYYIEIIYLGVSYVFHVKIYRFL